MQNKKGLIMGVANDRSIAWGIAKKLAEQGAEIALTYQGEALKKRVQPLAEEIGSNTIIPCDVSDSQSMNNVFETLKNKWGELDFLVHGIGFSNKDELRGKYYNTSSDNFKQTMHISCYSFTEACRLAEPLMNNGGSILTLTYYGSEQVMPHYNVMGVAKAALEAKARIDEDKEYFQEKITVSKFYMEQILPQVLGLIPAIKAGKEPMPFLRRFAFEVNQHNRRPVSYTHLTLPTIYSV